MKNVYPVGFAFGTKNTKNTAVIYEDVLKILCLLNIKGSMSMENGFKRTILRSESMSYSSLYVIKKDFTGENVADYKNSWVFSPMVWSVLCDKYIPRDIQTPYGYKKSIITDVSGELHRKLNNKVNNCENTPDRVCWEMSNQQIFFTKDKECIAESIKKFVEQNKQYDKSEKDNISPMEREHIIERFNKIAEHIIEIDENEYPYFVFKNNSVDDGVEFWFREYNEETEDYMPKSLDKWDKILAEFVVIENGSITDFIDNIKFFAKYQ